MQPEDELVAFAREWLTKADEDRFGAEMLAHSDRVLTLVAYHCQQAVEKSLKGFLSLRDRPFRRTHDLTELLGQCIEIDAAFSTYLDVARTRSPYAADLRYPGELGALSREQAMSAIRAAGDVLAFVRTRFPDTGHP